MFKMLLMLLLGCVCVVAHADQMGVPSCSGLSVTEQTFASGMSAANKDIFCSRFTQSMRNNAMDMSGMPDSYGNIMTPDQSVEKVARDNNIMPRTTNGGGCGVK